MRRSLLLRATVIAGITATVVLGSGGPASAHVSVTATDATPGGYTKAAFRVPNEKEDAGTTVVEINLPTDTPIASVSVKPLPGWTVVTTRGALPAPVETADGVVTEAVTKIVWTAADGVAIGPGQFEEFEVYLGPLPEAEQVVFKALQTYEDGDVVRWIEVPVAGGEEPANPAAVLQLAAATDEAVEAPAPEAVEAPAEDGTNRTGVAGILLGVAGLVAGLLAYRKAALQST
ncbi:YcnI family protein [Solwaraspora sp. WMMD1047]|uniref:YcnI family copper-binding membrane protein n=1 Tax=Solwaraspora sp. WMMD1047 TaxID=3016102 RepID=UPI0024161C1E|nr:YcnI family protein [Solwaraspora sp. WMMD1047]MDG4828146.1 YcnI family protein [Solwaraspora sp. WMMD1047]